MNTKQFKCILCGSTALRPWLKECHDYYLQKGMPVNYVECVACLLVQQHPLPEDISALYADYPVHSERNLLQRFARRIFHRQVYFTPKPGSENLSMLDFGCGDGTFLREMKGKFKELYGFEPDSSQAGKVSSRLNIKTYSSLKNLQQDLAEKIDLITAHFVLEHVPDLHATFHTFRKLLKPGGELHIAVPNIRSWESCLFKKFWHGLDAPRHLVFPEPAHFKVLSKKFGFEIARNSHATFPNTLAASISTVLSGQCHSKIFMGLIIPAWLISLCAPQGTCIIRMIRSKS